jgi:hemoglobin-like flavoprotein
MQNTLVKAIKKMFQENWTSLELGSSQTDRVEAYVLGTIKDVFQENEADILPMVKKINKLHNEIGVLDEELSIALNLMTGKQKNEWTRMIENLNQ